MFEADLKSRGGDNVKGSTYTESVQTRTIVEGAEGDGSDGEEDDTESDIDD